MRSVWRLGSKRWDWMRTVRCALTGHRWEANPRSGQRVCPRCWLIDDSEPVALAEHFKVCDCHDSWDQCPCAEGGHPRDGSCDCCPLGTGLCGPTPAGGSAPGSTGADEREVPAVPLAGPHLDGGVA